VRFPSKDQIPVLATALGVTIDSIGFRCAVLPPRNDDTDFGYMTVQKGRIAGFQKAPSRG